MNKKHGGTRPGAGRPTKNPEKKRVPLYVFVDPHTFKKIDEISQKTGLSRGQVIDECVKKLGTF